VEGPTDDPETLERRRRVRRAMLATLLLSAGVPMLVAGDELGRSQGGNNNAYCQDNPVSWLAWPVRSNGRGGWWRRAGRVADADEDIRAATGADGPDPRLPVPDPAGDDPALPDFVSCLLSLRRSSPALRRLRFFHGGESTEAHRADMTWFLADGTQMSDVDWNAPHPATVVAFLAGDSLGWLRPDGAPASGDSLLLVMHPGHEDTEVTLPGPPWASRYDLLLDSTTPDPTAARAAVEDARKPLATLPAGAALRTGWVSFLVLRAHR
jgi:glycogen operon protein